MHYMKIRSGQVIAGTDLDKLDDHDSTYIIDTI